MHSYIHSHIIFTHTNNNIKNISDHGKKILSYFKHQYVPDQTYITVTFRQASCNSATLITTTFTQAGKTNMAITKSITRKGYRPWGKGNNLWWLLKGE